MIPLSKLMNYSAHLTESNSFFQKKIASRVVTVAGCVPLELLATLYNTLKLPFQTCLLTTKISVKVVNLCISSKSLKEFEKYLPGPLEVLETALKIVAYALGSLITLTVGAFSPLLNFKLHHTVGLIRNEAAEAEKDRNEKEKISQRQESEKKLQAHIQNILEALRAQNTQKELLLATQRKPQALTRPAPKEAETPQETRDITLPLTPTPTPSVPPADPAIHQEDAA